MLYALKLNLLTTEIDDALFANEGALAEQFVGQELLANSDHEMLPGLFYWVREVKGAEAEVDYGDIRSYVYVFGDSSSYDSLHFMNSKARGGDSAMC